MNGSMLEISKGLKYIAKALVLCALIKASSTVAAGAYIDKWLEKLED
jgi:hypothetical protein